MPAWITYHCAAHQLIRLLDRSPFACPDAQLADTASSALAPKVLHVAGLLRELAQPLPEIRGLVTYFPSLDQRPILPIGRHLVAPHETRRQRACDHLKHRHSAIYMQRLPGHVAGLLTGEIERRDRDILR